MRTWWLSGALLVFAGCGGARASTGPPPAPPAHDEAPPPAEASAAGSLDGHYTFRRVYPGARSAFRQTFELSIDHGAASLRIVTADDEATRTNADVDRAAFSGPQKILEGKGSATTDPATGDLVLDLSGGTHWICQRLVVHVSPAGARLTRPASDDACREDSPVEPSATGEARVLSCRADNYAGGPPPLRGDQSQERRRDSHRWTFAPPPGVELLGDACPTRTGILRRAR